jgi:hypothetical protein
MDYDSEKENLDDIFNNDVEDGCFENSYAITQAWRLMDDETVLKKPSMNFNIPSMIFPIKPKVFIKDINIGTQQKKMVTKKEKSSEERQLIEKIILFADIWNKKERLKYDLPNIPSDIKKHTESDGILILSHIDAEMHVVRKSKTDLVNQSKNSASIPKCQLFYPLIKKNKNGTFSFKVMNIV